MSTRSALHAVVTETVGIYGAAPTCHLSALARIDGYEPRELKRAVEDERSLVRARLMRRSVYILGLDLLTIALAATRREVVQPFQRMSRRLGFDYEEFARKVERALAGGPLSATDIRRTVDPDMELGDGFTILLGLMGANCRLVRAATTGGWRSDRLTYARWRDWLPDVDPEGLAEADARRMLARAYVAAYGPVELDDLAWWAGWSKKDARAAAEGIDLAQAGNAMSRLQGVRLLPVWDALMVAYKNRIRLFAPEHAPLIYDRFGNATSVVLDAGKVVGVWDLGKSNDPLRVRVAPLERWPKRRWESVTEKANRIGRMIGAAKVEIVRHPAPTNLLTAPRNRFLAPLG